MLYKEIIAYLKIFHGLYNSLMIFLFLYQGFLGLRIRRERKTGSRSFHIIKRHRRLGPILTIGSMIGFFAGIFIVFINHRHIFHYPLHFMIGLLIILSVSNTFFISKKIKADDSKFRDIHFRLGLFILSLYIIQAFLGLGILL